MPTKGSFKKGGGSGVCVGEMWKRGRVLRKKDGRFYYAAKEGAEFDGKIAFRRLAMRKEGEDCEEKTIPLSRKE